MIGFIDTVVTAHIEPSAVGTTYLRHDNRNRR
jgi:hypothetical protein